MPRFRVLMIDDQPAEVDALRAAFLRLGETEAFEGANHAAEALDRLGPERDRFDLILLDQEWAPQIGPELLTDADGRLPAEGPPDYRRQGFGILRHLRQRGVTAPVVFCTRFADPVTALRAAEAGAATYYDKADLLSHPEWAFYTLQEGAADLAFVGRLLRRANVEADQLTCRWLAGQRAVWGRRWPLIAEAVVDRAAALGMAHASAGERLRLERTALPDILAACREPMAAVDLLSFLARHGVGGELHARRREPFWLVAAAGGAGPLLAVAEPDARHVHNAAPPDWAEATTAAAAAVPNVLAADVRRWPVGPTDPFWGVAQVCAAAAEPAPADAWRLDGADGPGCRPLPALAGRIGAPGESFWRELERQARAVGGLEFFARRAASVAALFAVAASPAGPEPRLRVVPFPSALLSDAALRRWARPPRQFLLQLQRGDPGPPEMSDADLDAELARLPGVEVRRGGWPHEFEEETLAVVLDALAAVPATPGRTRCVWLGCPFLHAEGGRRVTRWLREHDGVLLAPQGLLVLECKSSVLANDLLHGHQQVIEATRFVWGGSRGRSAWGGAFLAPALLPRLAGLRPDERVPNDVLAVVPDELARRLRTERGPHAADVVRDYYRELEAVPVRMGRPGLEHDPSAVRRGRREEVPAVVGYVVAPDDAGGTLPSSAVRRSQLGELLRQWLRLPPVLTPAQQELVREGLLRLSAADTAGLLEV